MISGNITRVPSSAHTLHTNAIGFWTHVAGSSLINQPGIYTGMQVL